MPQITCVCIVLRATPGTGSQREEASTKVSEGSMCSMAQATSTGSLFSHAHYCSVRILGHSVSSQRRRWWFKILQGVVGASPKPQTEKKTIDYSNENSDATNYDIEVCVCEQLKTQRQSTLQTLPYFISFKYSQILCVKYCLFEKLSEPPNPIDNHEGKNKLPQTLAVCIMRCS